MIGEIEVSRPRLNSNEHHMLGFYQDILPVAFKLTGLDPNFRFFEEKQFFEAYFSGLIQLFRFM
jgi:hypothetical protein